jgi:hypothetical protein
VRFGDKLRLVAPKVAPRSSSSATPANVIIYHRSLDLRARDPRLRVLHAFQEGFTAGAEVVTGRDNAWRLPLFLDTETTGLGVGPGTVPFLVGVAWLDKGGQLVIEQRLMTGFGAEAELLRWVHAIIDERADSLVTYNGLTFDLPLLDARCVMQRMPTLRRPPHLDLLHPARALWRGAMSDCRLSTLESQVLGYRRGNDIPGAEIPAAWLQMVRANAGPGDRAGAQVEAIVRHNRDDLVSLAALAALVCALFRGARVGGAALQARLGQALLRRRRTQAARRAFDYAREMGGSGGQLLSGLALAARRERDWEAEERALLAWLEGLERFDSDPYERLAILWEHRWCRFKDAAELIRRALQRGCRARELGTLFAPETEAALRHRLARLERRSLATVRSRNDSKTRHDGASPPDPSR